MEKSWKRNLQWSLGAVLLLASLALGACRAAPGVEIVQAEASPTRVPTLEAAPTMVVLQASPENATTMTSAPEPTASAAPAPTPTSDPTPTTPPEPRPVRQALEATDPAGVTLASGKVQFVEFFAFW